MLNDVENTGVDPEEVDSGNGETDNLETLGEGASESEKTEKKRGRPPIARKPVVKPPSAENKVVRLLEKNPLGMTLPEMAGGPRQLKRIKTLRPILAEAIRLGLIMPVSQRAGHTVYKLVKRS
ncbi:MAG: hypothetical protein J0M35_00745 [Candidatus Obscuribacter phosphatis]|uniref:Uncharacterized protein n=1 Tax=Candidatus Obscuribacter phosphatis TaxID=1906157 RepID=A0A8J7PF95_9BACT|nr:hypothetical protein [Candidatus Obscuribacter phosphatis]